MGDLLWGLLLGFAAGVGVTAGVFLLARRRPPAPVRRSAPPTMPAPEGKALLDSVLSEADAAGELRQNLRLKFLYDEAKIDQAIEYERQRQPQASPEELMRAAIARWERENR
jgi:hypothetical protein